MPLFDFVCRSCGKEFEALIVGGTKPECPACKSRDLKKQMSSFAVGSGGGGGSSPTSGSKCSGCAGGSCGSCH